MKRSKYQIILQILEICIGGSSKTQIVYQANLNFGTVRPHIDLLIDNGLLTVKKGSRIVYETTEKGTEFLERLKEITNEVSEL